MTTSNRTTGPRPPAEAPSEESSRHPASELTSNRTASRAGAVDVAAQAHQPSGRRRQTLWLVACPFCSVPGVESVHAHRGDPDSGVRRSGCDRGWYRLVADVRAVVA